MVVGDSMLIIYAQLGFKLDLELSIICFEFCFVFLYWWCFCWAGESAILLLLFLTCFLDVFVYLYCLMTRDIWCGVFELIFAHFFRMFKAVCIFLSAGVWCLSGFL